jgi:hypothetical protein
MKKSVVFLTFLGVVVIMIGLGITYSGTQKAEVTTTEASYSFGNNYLHDDLSNETYLRGGDFTIQNCKSDTLEIVAIIHRYHSINRNWAMFTSPCGKAESSQAFRGIDPTR